MKWHPLQGHEESVDRISGIFRAAMERDEVLPKDPWRAKKLTAWLEKMGGRFHPGSHHIRAYFVDTANFFNFKVTCPKFSVKKGRWQPRARGYRETRFVHIEIPWELADKVLMLGYLP